MELQNTQGRNTNLHLIQDHKLLFAYKLMMYGVNCKHNMDLKHLIVAQCIFTCLKF